MSFVFFFFPFNDFNPTERPIRNYRFTDVCSRDSCKEVVTGAYRYVCNQEQRKDGPTRIISARTTSPRFAKGTHGKGYSLSEDLSRFEVPRVALIKIRFFWDLSCLVDL
jgi:hypothetical protein